jgi:hypothetical protein
VGIFIAGNLLNPQTCQAPLLFGIKVELLPSSSAIARIAVVSSFCLEGVAITCHYPDIAESGKNRITDYALSGV